MRTNACLARPPNAPQVPSGARSGDKRGHGALGGACGRMRGWVGVGVYVHLLFVVVLML